MPGRLQDKIAVITGASGGIGRSIALAYHAEGAKVVCSDLQEGGLFTSNAAEKSATTHDLINARGGSALFVQADATKAADVEALIKTTVDTFGRIDIMVNNAGIALAGVPVWEVQVDHWERVMAINSTGVFLGTKYAAAQMLRQEPHASGDRGWIISTASVHGLSGTESAAAYCASKGSVVNFTRAAALDCAPHRIHVNCICPGYTSTAMTSAMLEDQDRKKKLEEAHGFDGRLGEPEDLAPVCVFLASEDARWMTGVALPVDGGFLAR